jgi:hypothetical protein
MSVHEGEATEARRGGGRPIAVPAAFFEAAFAVLDPLKVGNFDSTRPAEISYMTLTQIFWKPIVVGAESLSHRSQAADPWPRANPRGYPLPEEW